jgi:integrase/recombinase XerD
MAQQQKLDMNPSGTSAPLSPDTSLHAAIAAFQPYMEQRGFSPHTIEAFTSDLEILEEFAGVGTAIGQIGTRTLNAFVQWLKHGRGVPCSPKSLARRITTLKVFFGWLAETEVLPQDPAAPVVHKPVVTPLPTFLSPPEVERVLEVTRAMRTADPPDARPHLLVTLILHTGIKKGECMSIVLNHIDRSDPQQPVLWVRYADPNRRYKERKIGLPTGWLEVLDEYREQYEPEDVLFPWTPRNLEYVLKDVAEQADLPEGLSFETLRWTCAVRDHRSGMDPDRLRQKLGLSKISWRETGDKIARLAADPL